MVEVEVDVIVEVTVEVVRVDEVLVANDVVLVLVPGVTLQLSAFL